MSEHITSRKTYFLIFFVLLALTATTVGAAMIDLGPLSVWVALLIAATKASLVALFFMHVRYASGLTKVFVVGGLFWLVILLGLTFSDYISRNWIPMPAPW